MTTDQSIIMSDSNKEFNTPVSKSFDGLSDTGLDQPSQEYIHRELTETYTYCYKQVIEVRVSSSRYNCPDCILADKILDHLERFISREELRSIGSFKELIQLAKKYRYDFVGQSNGINAAVVIDKQQIKSEVHGILKEIAHEAIGKLNENSKRHLCKSMPFHVQILVDGDGNWHALGLAASLDNLIHCPFCGLYLAHFEKDKKKCDNCSKAIDTDYYYNLVFHSPPGNKLCSNQCLFEFVLVEMLVGEEISTEQLKIIIDHVQEEVLDV